MNQLKTEVYDCSVCVERNDSDRACLCIVPSSRVIPNNCLYDMCDNLPNWKKLGEGNFA